MKKIIFLFVAGVLFCLNSNVFAQWQTNGSNIYYNVGNVGIGTDSPTNILSLSFTQPNSGDGISLQNLSDIARTSVTLNNDGVNNYLQIGIHGTHHTGQILGRDRANMIYLRGANSSGIYIYTGTDSGIDDCPILFGVNGNKVAELRTDKNFEISNNGKGMILTAPDGGKWLVTVDNNGSLTTSATTKISEIGNENNIKIYPNPTENRIKIDLNTNKFQEINVELYDISGKMIYMKSYKTNIVNVSLSDFEAGTYILRIINSTGQIIKTKKLIKK